MNQVSYYSNDKFNQIEQYQPFANAIAYLEQKFESLIATNEAQVVIKDLALKLGYQDLAEFEIERDNWHRLKKSIPLLYLKELGIELEVLKFTVELDQSECETALESELFPKYAAFRISSGSYQDLKLPYQIINRDAIDFLQEYARQEEKTCCINYPGLKTVWISKQGQVKTIYYLPEIKITDEYVIPRLIAKKMAKASLK